MRLPAHVSVRAARGIDVEHGPVGRKEGVEEEAEVELGQLFGQVGQVESRLSLRDKTPREGRVCVGGAIPSVGCAANNGTERRIWVCGVGKKGVVRETGRVRHGGLNDWVLLW